MMWISRIRRLLPSKHLLITFSIMNGLLLFMYHKMAAMFPELMHESLFNVTGYINYTMPEEILEINDHNFEDISQIGQLDATTPQTIDDTPGGAMFIREPSGGCADKHMFVIIVNSAIGNDYLRQLIRHTWGNVATHEASSNFSVKLIFVVGTGHAVAIAPEVRSEANSYGDILVVNVQDTKMNITRKLITAFDWIKISCDLNEVDFIFKTDDDVFVNLFHIMKRAADIYRQKHVHFVCPLAKNRPVIHQGGVPRSHYPRNAYPTHCRGGGYMITRQGLVLVLNSMKAIDPLPAEDVFITAFAISKVYPNIEILYRRMSREMALMDKEEVALVLSREGTPGLANRTLVHSLSPQYWSEVNQHILSHYL